MRGKQLLALGISVFLITATITVEGLKGNLHGVSVDEADLGKICLSGSLAAASRGGERTDNLQEGAELQSGQKGSEIIVGDKAEAVLKNSVAAGEEAVGEGDVSETGTEKSLQVTDSSGPLVIIYHTHATESYQPASQGNFHILEEASSVREVGNILENELKNRGIQVIHDKTIHDNPSYNQSYGRSLETVNGLLAKYPNATVVIDLHRDAAAYSGGTGKTVLVNGETVAKYNLVVGNGNPNTETLKQFADTINAKAEEMYPGFGGRIIEKAYKFNQYVSDRHILLEIGNNENNIREADACARYFADVLESVIKDMQALP
ncbi:MAG: stage II sporulation protein P [Anaerovoracaceae bacterium]